MFKHIFLGIAVLLLAGCVAYYPYPERVYSASDNTTQVYDQGYDTEQYDSADEASVVYGSNYYYPWWSVDYFYLGNHYYRPSLSFSFSYGSPWYSPYYGYYGYPHHHSPWYPAYGYPYAYYGPQSWWSLGFSFGYGYGYGWNDPYWYNRYRGHDHYRYGHNYYGHKGGYGRRYAGYGGHGRGYDQYGRGQGRGYDGYENRHQQDGYRRDGQYADRYDRGERNGNRNGNPNRTYQPVDPGRRGQHSQIPTDRRVSVAPSGPGTDRGMVVVNRNDGKTRQSRVQPIASQEGHGQAVVREPRSNREAHAVPQPGSNRQAHTVQQPGPNRESRTVQQGSMRVVQPGENKQGRSRTGMPAYPGRSSGGPEVVMNQPPQRSNQPRSNQPVVRMPVPDRQGQPAYMPPPRSDGQFGGRAPEPQARSHGGGGGRESNGGGNRESRGGDGRGPRGEHGGRGNRDRD